jgi:hypothetical protein
MQSRQVKVALLQWFRWASSFFLVRTSPQAWQEGGEKVSAGTDKKEGEAQSGVVWGG